MLWKARGDYPHGDRVDRYVVAPTEGEGKMGKGGHRESVVSAQDNSPAYFAVPQRRGLSRDGPVWVGNAYLDLFGFIWINILITLELPSPFSAGLGTPPPPREVERMEIPPTLISQSHRFHHGVGHRLRLGARVGASGSRQRSLHN